jgi:hypothetical protein
LTGRRGTVKEQQDNSTTPAEPRRDLLVLLREQKTVQQSDLMDRENRRLLHFLMYEHKMGISLQELHKSITQQPSAAAADSVDRRQQVHC